MKRCLSLGVSAWVLALVSAFGCQTIVGIEDKTLDACDEQCQVCNEYCDLAMENCTEENAVYKQRETCIGVCNVLPLGELGEPVNANTVACRLEQAKKAVSEPEVNCDSAGPAGGNQCGTDCASFCYLLETACPANYKSDKLTSTQDCLDKCAGLPDAQEFDVEGYYDTNTVECRIIHLANVPALGTAHCGHGDFKSTEHCGPPATEPPSCLDYCDMVMAECKGDHLVYDDLDTCRAVCDALSVDLLGTNTDTTENTVGCRHYHSFNSVVDPQIHCSHAGPSGSGHCGELEDGVGNCESYCLLAKAGCPTLYQATFAGDDDACRAACADDPGAGDDPNTDINETEQYSVRLAESGNENTTHQCRVLHATRAILAGNEPAVECSAVFGTGDCL
jgi:hypothetical protein